MRCRTHTLHMLLHAPVAPVAVLLHLWPLRMVPNTQVACICCPCCIWCCRPQNVPCCRMVAWLQTVAPEDHTRDMSVGHHILLCFPLMGKEDVVPDTHAASCTCCPCCRVAACLQTVAPDAAVQTEEDVVLNTHVAHAASCTCCAVAAATLHACRLWHVYNR
jgi:hypothetical protein